jgi:hypothetical protein
MITEYLESLTKMMATMRKRELNTYLCMEDFILKNGQGFNGNRSKVKLGRSKECFKNAYLLADSRDDVIYTEGFATIPKLNLPVMHAWCVDKKGCVFDPTWKDGAEYFGIKFDLKFVRKTILARKKYGVIDNWEERWPLLYGKVKPEEFLYKGGKNE